MQIKIRPQQGLSVIENGKDLMLINRAGSCVGTHAEQDFLRDAFSMYVASKKRYRSKCLFEKYLGCQVIK